jgi:hypothetical protein
MMLWSWLFPRGEVVIGQACIGDGKYRRYVPTLAQIERQVTSLSIRLTVDEYPRVAAQDHAAGGVFGRRRIEDGLRKLPARE